MNRVIVFLTIAFTATFASLSENGDSEICCLMDTEGVTYVVIPAIEVSVKGLKRNSIFVVDSALSLFESAEELSDREIGEIGEVIRFSLRGLSFVQFKNQKIKDEIRKLAHIELEKCFEDDQLTQVVLNQLIFKQPNMIFVKSNGYHC